MSESSDQCELCSNQSNRVFPCLYHCKKMLCIQHLSEHEKYIEKQIQFQKELENLWKNYLEIFNEEKLLNEYKQLKLKIEYYRQLKKEVNHLLLINHFQNSIENNQKFEKIIQLIRNAIQQENQSNQKLNDIHLKIEAEDEEEEEEEEDEDEEEHQRNTDYSSFSSSLLTTNDDCETVDSLPSMLNPNGNSPLHDDYFQKNDESDDHGNSIEMENEDEHSFKDATSVTPSRNITASKVRGYCPLTYDGAYGVKSRIHNIRLCLNPPSRTYRLNEHFRRVHHLTSFASLSLCRAVRSGQNPLTTQLFTDQHIILNYEELRIVNCPIIKPFTNYPLLQIENCPCSTRKQIQHLKEHLRRVHKFTNQASNTIMKAVKTNKPVDLIEFAGWFEIIEHDNLI